MKGFFLLLGLFLGSVKLNVDQRAHTCSEVLEEMLKTIKQVRTAQYHLYAVERVKDKVLTASSAIKIQMEPLKIYFKNHKGIEVLYVQGMNKGDCWVNPNSFPYVTLSLDPMRSIMRNNQHHTLLDLGFNQIGKVVESSIRKSGKDFNRDFTLIGSVQHNNRDCYKLFFEYPEFNWVVYSVLKNETPRTIADKLGISEYRILQFNSGLNSNEIIKEGRKIKVPNAYAAKTIMYVDKQLMLPVYIKIFDEEGLFEYYDFSDITINLNFPAETFRKENVQYGF